MRVIAMQRDEKVRDLAYRLWESRGRPQDGSEQQDWLEAERQLSREPPLLTEEAAPAASVSDETLKASFPASDPPASRLPDKPPSNADAKWQAAAASSDETAKRATMRRRAPGASNSKSAE
jgi:hypothetical protein